MFWWRSDVKREGQDKLGLEGFLKWFQGFAERFGKPAKRAK